MNHKEIVISIGEELKREALIAALCEIGYDGFAEETNELKAYIEEEHFDSSLRHFDSTLIITVCYLTVFRCFS